MASSQEQDDALEAWLVQRDRYTLLDWETELADSGYHRFYKQLVDLAHGVGDLGSRTSFSLELMKIAQMMPVENIIPMLGILNLSDQNLELLEQALAMSLNHDAANLGFINSKEHDAVCDQAAEKVCSFLSSNPRYLVTYYQQMLEAMEYHLPQCLGRLKILVDGAIRNFEITPKLPGLSGKFVAVFESGETLAPYLSAALHYESNESIENFLSELI